MATKKKQQIRYRAVFQPVYGDDGPDRYSVVADLRTMLEEEGIETRGEECEGNMEILVPKKDARRAVDLICRECDQRCGVSTRYRAIIYYRHVGYVSWTEFDKGLVSYSSKSFARESARIIILDFKKKYLDGDKQLKFRVKIEEVDPKDNDEDADTSLSENQA